MRPSKSSLLLICSLSIMGSASAQWGYANSTPQLPGNGRSYPAPVYQQAPPALVSHAPQYTPPLRGQLSVVPQGGYFNPGYAQSENRQHLGTDYRAASGTPVYAAANGRVQYNTTNLNNPYNSQVTVQTDSSQVVYGHVYSTTTPGQVVQRGQYIGYVQPGNPAQPAYSPHLHVGINSQGNAGTTGWGRAPVATTAQQAQQRGWIDANGVFHATQR
jgi:murein DD-endopeptidase MepM/ murein hydrolase activator NlpD